MRSGGRPAPAYRRTLPLLLLLCALGLTVGGLTVEGVPVGVAAHAVGTHKHLPRAVVVSATGGVADHPGAHRSNPADPAPTTAVPITLPRTAANPADRSSVSSAVSASLPPVRGPPAQASG